MCSGCVGAVFLHFPACILLPTCVAFLSFFRELGRALAGGGAFEKSFTQVPEIRAPGDPRSPAGICVRAHPRQAPQTFCEFVAMHPARARALICLPRARPGHAGHEIIDGVTLRELTPSVFWHVGVKLAYVRARAGCEQSNVYGLGQKACTVDVFYLLAP